MPDEDAYQGSPAAALSDTPSSVAGDSVSTPLGTQEGEGDPRWVFMAGDMVQGPFTDEEMRGMIHHGDVLPDTPIRMGERPWVPAGKIGIFQQLFIAARASETAGEDVESPPGRERVTSAATQRLTEALSEETIGGFLYPVRDGKWLPLAIFAGIAAVLSTILCFDFTIGIIVNVLAWAVLYGYLVSLMHESRDHPTEPPPGWDFGRIKQMAVSGAKVLAVLVPLCLLPTSLCVVLMIYFFLNAMSLLGYVFVLLVVVVFAVTLLAVTAGLSVLARTGSVVAALNPLGILSAIRNGGSEYRKLAVHSLVVGMACMLVTLLAVFLTDIPGLGFVVAGLLMGVVFSYGHFIWFHELGRFSSQDQGDADPAELPA
jgi:hypothetical protein